MSKRIPTREKKSSKECSISVRCTEEQKEVLEKIASQQGLGVSTWLLHTGLKVAQRQTASR
jgi:uncharacterized protein (DUF1778 family)